MYRGQTTRNYGSNSTSPYQQQQETRQTSVRVNQQPATNATGFGGGNSGFKRSDGNAKQNFGSHPQSVPFGNRPRNDFNNRGANRSFTANTPNRDQGNSSRGQATRPFGGGNQSINSGAANPFSRGRSSRSVAAQPMNMGSRPAQNEEPSVQKVEEPVAQKVEEPVIQKVEEPVIQKAEEPVIQKVQEPVIQKVQEPVIQKVQEPVVQKVEEAVFPPNVQAPPVQVDSVVSGSVPAHHGKPPVESTEGSQLGDVSEALARGQKINFEFDHLTTKVQFFVENGRGFCSFYSPAHPVAVSFSN